MTARRPPPPMCVPHWDTQRLDELYRHIFSDVRTDAEFRLDGLQARQEELIDTLTKIPVTASRTLAKVQAQIDQIDMEIRDAEAKLENAADAFNKASEEYERISREWQEAQRSVETESSARRKAEAVRKVVSRINLLFRPTGKRRPVSELLAIEWVPVGAEISLRPQPSPHRTGSQSVSSSRVPGSPSP